MPVITNEEPDKVSLLYWGLIPFWVKDEATALHIRLHTLNARAETVCNKPAFRHCVVTRRCLVLVDGFFEWRQVNGKKYPYCIKLKDNIPFALAGIWDTWHDMKTFSVITTEANSLMAEIHNTSKRMPVILTRANENRWLDSSLPPDEVKLILKPYDPAEMYAYPVDRSIIKMGLNTTDPSILNETQYEDLPAIITV
jgi:putative SOS response-associated peptidase YedK